MSVSLSIIIKTDFKKRNDKESTLKELEETAAILNKAEGVDSYYVDTDDTFDQWCITGIDDEHYFDHFLSQVSLFNGFLV